jgi:hypothetical protein
MPIINTNRVPVSPGDVLDAINPVVVQANTFAPSQAVYLDGAGNWALAQNTAAGTLGTHIILEATSGSLRIAQPGDVIDGLAGLTPGQPLHTSPTTPGELVGVASGQSKPAGAFASNVLAYAVSPTTAIVTQTTAFLTT